ncbi:MAG TPA: trehalose-phosphatase [Candidatus Aquilonibacter sp.]|nr:trehalose-phosphatase [Candidatus Aquilonibacter sp.]
MTEKVSLITRGSRRGTTEISARTGELRSIGQPRPRYAFRALTEIAGQLSDAPNRVLLLDLDGTLVRLRRRPEDVRVSLKAKAILERLSRLPNTTVAILSGRSVRSLEKMVGVKSLHYFGLHGGEETRKAAKISVEQRKALSRARRSARDAMAEFSGVKIEDKKYGFTVHYRGADKAAIRGANEALLAIMAPLRHALHVLDGKKVWEVLPRQIPGKGSTMKRVLADSPHSALAYIGDDEPDEPAFAALEGHVTIHVGDNKNTNALFYLRNPGEVLRFLNTLEKELR